MTVFTVTFGLKGANGKISRMTMKTKDIAGLLPDAFAEAVSLATDLSNGIQAISDATMAEVNITHNVSASSVAGAGDVFEKALLVLRIPTTEQPDKSANWLIPAPSIDIFQGATGVDRDRVDISNADLINTVQLLADWTISDGEEVDLTVNNGLRSGHRVVSKVQLG